MVATPELYLENIIKPMVRRFEADPTAYDLGFACCVFLYHFCDVVCAQSGGTPGDIKKQIATKDRNFDLVHAVAVAAKHVFVSDKRLAGYVGLRSDDADIGRRAPFSDGSFFSDGTSFSEMPPAIRVKSPDGRWHDLLFVVTSCTKTIEDGFV